MDIRIESVAGDPPTWKVFLGTFFWSCSSYEEALAWAESAAHFLDTNSLVSYQLPAPMRAASKKFQPPCGEVQWSDYIQIDPMDRVYCYPSASKIP
jgi:hypothetical protein